METVVNSLKFVWSLWRLSDIAVVGQLENIMPVRIYDISKKLGLENKDIISKAKALGITAAKVASSSLDKITAEFLEEEILKDHPDIAAKLHAPKVETPKAPVVEEKIVVITAPPPPPPAPPVEVVTQQPVPVMATAAAVEAEPPPAVVEPKFEPQV